MIQFTINKNAFLAAIRITKQSISSKNAIPVLSKLKIVVKEEGISLTGSNGQTSIEKFIPADDENAAMVITEPGAILLEADKFDSVVGNMPELILEFEEIENYQAVLRSGKYTATIKGQDAELYPRIQEISSTSFMKLEVGKLKDLFSETAFAVSTQESRPILTGVHLILVDHTDLVAVATDSHRMSQRLLKLDTISENFEVVIPKRAIDSFKNVFTDEEESVRVFMSGSQLLFKTDKISFYTRLLEGNYPETERLIPSEADFTLDLTFDVADLLHAMNRAALLASTIGENGTVKFNVSEESIVSSVNSPEVGSSQEEVNYLEKAGADLQISFNPRFMIDSLKVIKEPQVRVRFISSVRPFVITPKNEGNAYTQIITPVRTN